MGLILKKRVKLTENVEDWLEILLNGTGTIWGPCGVEDVEEESVICGKFRTKLNKERDIAVTDDPAVQSTVDHDSTGVLEHITTISGPPFLQ